MIQFPSSILLVNQIVIIPLIVIFMITNNVIRKNELIAYVLFSYSVAQLVNSMSSVHFNSVGVLQQSINFLIISLVSFIILFNCVGCFDTASSLFESLSYVSSDYCYVFIFGCVIHLISHFPGSKCHVEAVVMVQVMLFCLLMMGVDPSEHLDNFITDTNLIISESLLQHNVACRLYFAVVFFSLAMLFVLKSRFLFGRVHNSVYLVVACLCGLSVLMYVCIELVFALELMSLRRSPRILGVFCLEFCEIALNWAAILAVFVSARFAARWFTQLVPGVNVYYNRLHRRLFLTFIRKSYHALLLCVYYASGSRALPYYLLSSSLAVFFLCFVEALRGAANIFPLNIYYKHSQKFVTDIEQQVALPQIQLLISASLFQPLSFYFPKGNLVSNVGLACVVVGDAVAAILPQLYEWLIDQRLVKWAGFNTCSFVYLPAFVNYIFPHLDEKQAVKQDLQARGLQITDQIKISIKAVGPPQMRVLNFKFGKHLHIFGQRSVIGTCACVAAIYLVLSNYSDNGSMGKIVAISLVVGLSESFSVADNMLLGFIALVVELIYDGIVKKSE